MTDIKRARRKRAQDERRAARREWVNQMSVQICMSWPPGVLGAVVGVMFMLTPPMFWVISVRIVMWFEQRRRKRRGGTPEDAA